MTSRYTTVGPPLSRLNERQWILATVSSVLAPLQGIPPNCPALQHLRGARLTAQPHEEGREITARLTWRGESTRSNFCLPHSLTGRGETTTIPGYDGSPHSLTKRGENTAHRTTSRRGARDPSTGRSHLHVPLAAACPIRPHGVYPSKVYRISTKYT